MMLPICLSKKIVVHISKEQVPACDIQRAYGALSEILKAKSLANGRFSLHFEREFATGELPTLVEKFQLRKREPRQIGCITSSNGILARESGINYKENGIVSVVPKSCPFTPDQKSINGDHETKENFPMLPEIPPNHKEVIPVVTDLAVQSPVVTSNNKIPEKPPSQEGDTTQRSNTPSTSSQTESTSSHQDFNLDLSKRQSLPLYEPLPKPTKRWRSSLAFFTNNIAGNLNKRRRLTVDEVHSPQLHEDESTTELTNSASTSATLSAQSPQSLCDSMSEQSVELNQLIVDIKKEMCNDDEPNATVSDHTAATGDDQETQGEPATNGIENKPFPCSICGKPFKYSKRLQTHILQKHPEIPQPSPIKEEPSSPDEAVVEITDEVVLDYHCTICGHLFASETNLRRHIAFNHRE